MKKPIRTLAEFRRRLTPGTELAVLYPHYLRRGRNVADKNVVMGLTVQKVTAAGAYLEKDDPLGEPDRPGYPSTKVTFLDLVSAKWFEFKGDEVIYRDPDTEAVLARYRFVGGE